MGFDFMDGGLKIVASFKIVDKKWIIWCNPIKQSLFLWAFEQKEKD